ncbi:MAG: nucleotidyltransferase domain-containing protein [Chloroflexota bacterium]|nr:nucleotidyltransferase domain-containing protein [Chloroflexota bacterium]
MQLQTPLDDVLDTSANVRILRAMVGLPRGFAASARDIARRAGVAHTTASRTLQSLARQRVVRWERVARADLYQFNEQHVFSPAFRALFDAEAGLSAELVEYLRTKLPSIVGKAEAAFLFGSASRGTMRSASDIDVAVIAPKRPEAELETAFSALSDNVRERFGSSLNIVVGPTRRGHQRSKLWGRIEDEGIPLLPTSSKRG